MVGVPEVTIALVIAALWAVPVAAAVWVLFTLKRIGAGQQAMQLKLDSIERLLQRS